MPISVLKTTASADGGLLRQGEGLPAFTMRASGWHHLYVGVLAVSVAGLNFAPLELQRRVIDRAISKGDIDLMVWLCLAMLAAIVLQGGLKYALMLYQSWVSESAIEASRRQIAAAALRPGKGGDGAGHAVGVLGPEIEEVGSFVGAGISESVVNATFVLVTISYMLYLKPAVAIGCLLLLSPQLLLAPLLQPRLDRLVERQVKLVRLLAARVTRARAVSQRAALQAIGALYLNRMAYYATKYALKGLLNFASSLAPLAALAGGGYFVIQGELTLGELVVFISGLDRLASPLRDLLNFYRTAAQARVQHALILDWLAARGGDGGPAAALRR